MHANSLNGLFGLRLAHGLHLGHLVGNIRPAIADKEKRTIVIVLADLFTYTSSRNENITINNILSMTAESLSLGLDSANVKYVIQSQTFNSLLPLFTILSCLLKFEKLKKTQPIKKILENNHGVKFGELVFPIIQCAEMVSTNSEVLYSNIDNLGIVSLAEFLYRRLESYTNTVLPRPKINYGEFKNIKGIDYNKMSQSRNNAIFINDTHEIIDKKINSINTHVNNKEIDLQLLFDYFKIIGYSSEDISSLENDFAENKTTPKKIKMQLASEIAEYFAPIKKRKEEIMNDKKYLIERINSDTENVKFAILKNVSGIFQNFYGIDFCKTFRF